MKSPFTWDKNFDRKTILSKLAKARSVKDGRCGFSAGDYGYWLPVLSSAVQAQHGVDSLKSLCIKTALHDPSVNPQDDDAFLAACVAEFKRLGQRSETKFVMYTTVTYAGPRLFKWIADGDARIYWGPSPSGTFLRRVKKSHAALEDILSGRHVRLDAPGLTPIVIHVSAHDVHAAYEKANDSFDHLRALLNLFVNSNRSINPFAVLATPHAVNKFRRGPYQTIHKPDGTLAVETAWYEPRWHHSQPSAQFKNDNQKFERNLRGWWDKFQNNPLNDIISRALLRYCRALDSHEADAALLGLWQVLEGITASDRYEVLIHRLIRIFKDTNDARQVAQHIRKRRNQSVHTGQEITREADAILLQAEALARQSILFCMGQGRKFNSHVELCEFLDLTFDQSRLRRQQELIDLFIEYQNRP